MASSKSNVELDLLRVSQKSCTILISDSFHINYYLMLTFWKSQNKAMPALIYKQIESWRKRDENFVSVYYLCK